MKKPCNDSDNSRLIKIFASILLQVLKIIFDFNLKDVFLSLFIWKYCKCMNLDK
jgi:hypothetical protein